LAFGFLGNTMGKPRIKLIDIYDAVAKEVAHSEDQSKTNIVNIIKIYIKNLKKDGFIIRTYIKTRANSSARIVNSLVSKTYEKKVF
tara:strand:+ start:283 stop:540 length:258 start_codon:yes stop_codon:yes gene_type:complete